MRVSAALFALTLFTLRESALAATGDWPMDQGGFSRSGYAPGKIQYQEQHLRWDVPIGPSVSNPIVIEGKVVVSIPGRGVAALDAGTGEHQWVFVEKKAARAIAGAGNRVIVATVDGQLVGLASDTGKPLWRTAALRGPLQLAVHGDLVLAQSADGALSAYSASDGTRLWSAPGRATGPYASAGDDAFAPVRGGLLTVRLGDGATGFMQLDDAPISILGSGDGKLLLLFPREARLFDSKLRRSLWTWKAPATLRPTLAAANPTVAVIWDGEGGVHGLDLSSGRKLWGFDVASPAAASPVLNDTSVLLAARNGFFYALDVESGRELFRQQTWRPVGRQLALSGGSVFVWSSEGRLSCYLEYLGGEHVEGAIGDSFGVDTQAPGREVALTRPGGGGVVPGSQVAHYMVTRELRRVVAELETNIRSGGGRKPVVGLLPLDNLAKTGPDWTPVLTDLLALELAGSKALTAVERQRVDDVVKELKLSESGVVDPQRAVKAGKLLSADKLVFGTVARVGDFYQLSARMVDTQSGALVATSQVLIRRALLAQSPP